MTTAPFSRRHPTPGCPLTCAQSTGMNPSWVWLRRHTRPYCFLTLPVRYMCKSFFLCRLPWRRTSLTAAFRRERYTSRLPRMPSMVLKQAVRRWWSSRVLHVTGWATARQARVAAAPPRTASAAATSTLSATQHRVSSTPRAPLDKAQACDMNPFEIDPRNSNFAFCLCFYPAKST